MKKTIGIIALSVVGGVAGAFLFYKYKAKKKCPCQDKEATATPVTSGTTADTMIKQAAAPVSVSTPLAADGWGK